MADLKIPKWVSDELLNWFGRNQEAVRQLRPNSKYGILNVCDDFSAFINGRYTMRPELQGWFLAKEGRIETAVAYLNPLTRKYVEVQDD